MLRGEAASVAEGVGRVIALQDERLLLQEPLLHTGSEATLADRAGDGVRVRVVRLQRVRAERHRHERRPGRMVAARRTVFARAGHRTRDARAVRCLRRRRGAARQRQSRARRRVRRRAGRERRRSTTRARNARTRTDLLAASVRGGQRTRRGHHSQLSGRRGRHGSGSGLLLLLLRRILELCGGRLDETLRHALQLSRLLSRRLQRVAMVCGELHVWRRSGST